MTAHVAPQRWRDDCDAATRAAMDAHADRCEACARVRARIARAGDAFVAIRNQRTPELAWDSVRARVHWAVSTERRNSPRIPAAVARRRGWLAFGGVAVAGVFAIVAVDVPQQTADTPSLADRPAPAPVAPASAAPAALAGLVNRTTGEVMIDGVRPKPATLFARRLGAGNVIATAEGSVDVQFGNASGFALGPRSTLELVRFDARTIELVVEGVIDIEVGPRAADQRFVVHAGSRTVEVRGTQFRVRYVAGPNGTTSIACRHGLVAVRDARGQLEVAAERRLDLAVDGAVADHHVANLSSEDVAALVDATPLTMPIWNLDTLASSAPLEIDTAGRRSVRVDGLELGTAPMRVRVMPGRHTVEAADGAGRYRRAGWIDVAAPEAGARIARLDVRVDPSPSPSFGGIAARQRFLRASIDRKQINQCLRKIAKAGLMSGTYVAIEIGVDAQGAVGFLNVLDSDLPNSTSRCIRGVLADVRFTPGAAATWRERIDL